MFLLKAVVFAASISSVSYAVACPDSKHEQKADLASVSVDKAAKLHKAGKVIMVDANSPDTRKDVGIVPGARLLTSYDSFKAGELKAKKDDTLVFYCYNESCSAAPAAAKLAMKQGFKTKVMDAGIIGWKKAGHPVKRI